MDRLEEASGPKTVETKYGVFTFHRYRLTDYPKVDAIVRRIYIDAGLITSSDSIATLRSIIGLPVPDEGDAPPAVLDYIYLVSAARLDVLSQEKPEGFGSWTDVEDTDEVLRVSGVVQEWLDSFRQAIPAEKTDVGS